NGKLIGALAYAWSFAKTPIAGVTPIAQMLEAFEPGSSPVRLGGTLRAAEPFTVDGMRVERGVVVPPGTAMNAAPGVATLTPISTPVIVTGLSPKLMEALREAMEPLGLVPLAGGGAMGHVDTKMVPGQSVGAQLVGGDIDLTAVGTVTYVKDDVVLAFGHPMASLGTTDIPLVASYVHGVLPSQNISFKLASGGQKLGHFTQDRPWCIGGRLGGEAALIEGELRISDVDRRVTRSYGVEVLRNRALTSMLLVAVLAGAIDSVGPPAEGTTRARFSLEAEGLPKLERENTYTMEAGGGLLSLLLGAFGGGESATGELSDILDVLQNSEFGEAKLERLAVEIELSKTRRVARLEDVSISTPIVKPGDEVEMQISIRTSNGGLVETTRTIEIPASCPPGRVRVGVAGGRSAEGLRSRLEISQPRPVTTAQMLEQMMTRPSNDELVIDLALRTVGLEARGYAFQDLPPAAIDILRSATARRLRTLRDHVETRSQTDWVVSGSQVLTLMVEGKEQDKGGRPPAPEYEPPRYEQITGGFLDLFGGAPFSTGRTSLRRRVADEDQIDFDAPPPMPSWEEVETVGERELSVPSLARKTEGEAVEKGEAIGRVASVWRLADPRELMEGETEGTAIVSTGGVMLAPAEEELAEIASRCLWPVAVSPDGSVYVGQWTDGRLYRILGNGQADCVLETEAAGMQAIAIDTEGVAYAAAVPGGTIYRVRPDSDPEEIVTLGVQNVWALAFDGRGDLWAATGPTGELYRIAEGQPEVVLTAADRHITCLAIGTDDTVYAGTAPLGKVYAVSADGAVRSVCELDDAAIQSMGVDAQQNVYVGTSPKARVFKITPQGVATEILKVKGKHIPALLVWPSGTVLAASGPGARLIVAYPDGSSSLAYEPKTAYVAGLSADGRGDVYLALADTGRVVRLDPTGKREGSYISPPHDAKARAKWGAVRWRARLPEHATLTVFTRSGATAYPDETWTPWEAVPGQGEVTVSPPGRFLQAKIDLAGEGPDVPAVEAIEFTYLPANRAPEVELTSPSGDELWSGRQTIRWKVRDPDRDQLQYEVYWSSDHGNTWTQINAPTEVEEEGEENDGEMPENEGNNHNADVARLPAVGSYEIAGTQSAFTGLPPAWTSLRMGTGDFEDPLLDADVDEIMGEFEEDMSDGFEGEEEMESPPSGSSGPGLRSTSQKWDTATIEDGTYWIKVVANDGRSNPGDPLRAEATSRGFIVDNTPPEVIVDRRRGEDELPPDSVTVYEATTYLTSAEFRIDEGEWLAAMPGDGIFDGQYETVMLDADRLPAGTHEVELRARDAAGNVASGKLRYTR
ncbi:MAG: hypothetical protein JXA57_06325, partial [Armatimonadetes bacterium]|nr:hypothetical protein [Armatimonadota bacterium]